MATSYGYDSLYQLLSATQGGTTTESHNYDPVGNRLSSLGVPSYTVNSSNELTADSNASFTYDANGNTLTKTDSTGTTQYTWEFENRLSSVTLPGSGGTVSFKYDPFGRRIEKISPTATTIFVYDEDNLVVTVNSTGGTVSRYTQGQNIDEPLAIQQGTTTYYYEQDALGSVTSLTASNGTVAQSYTFDSFGKQTASSGSLTNPFQYTARESDQETGLYYYHARYYDPSVGRFLSEDPLGFGADGTNFYPYVENDPVDWTDSSGYSRDTYVPDPSHHGGPHIDRYSPEGQNVGRYDPDGRPLKHKGKPSPPIPNSDWEKFNKAADKLKKKPKPSTLCDPKQKSVPANSPKPVVPVTPILPSPGLTPLLPNIPGLPELPDVPFLPEFLPIPI